METIHSQKNSSPYFIPGFLVNECCGHFLASHLIIPSLEKMEDKVQEKKDSIRNAGFTMVLAVAIVSKIFAVA